MLVDFSLLTKNYVNLALILQNHLFGLQISKMELFSLAENIYQVLIFLFNGISTLMGYLMPKLFL